MPRHKYKRITQDELCEEVSQIANVSLDDVKYLLGVFVKQIKDDLCKAVDGLDVWVKVTDDIAFKAVYKPEKTYQRYGEEYAAKESIVPTLEYSDYEKEALAKNYEQVRFYERLYREHEEKLKAATDA